MAFVLEDGSGLSNSNGYIDEAFFVTYLTDRGRSLIDPLTSVQYITALINSAIVVSSDFLDGKFEFIGIRKLSTQSMEWPRVSASYQDGRQAEFVPVEVQEAVAELALKQLAEEIAPDPEYSDTNQPVTFLHQRVGPIEEKTSFVDGGSPILFRQYPFAEQKLKELIINGRFVERI